MDVRYVIRLMQRMRVRRAPVDDGGEVAGMHGGVVDRKRAKAIVAALTLVVGLVIGCTPKKGETFRHDLDSQATPWTHQEFDDAEEKWTFAIFGDLTGGERDQVFEVAVAQMNLLRPELIINVGDLVEGATDDVAELHRQWDSFDRRAREARAPLFYVGGNHDLTGEVLRQAWAERVGPRYYHFVFKNVLFLVLDTEDNSPERMREIERARLEAVEVYQRDGMEAFAATEYARMPERTSGTVGAEQAAYFRRVIADNADVRWTFVFTHKPAWQRDGEKEFASIESELLDRPYTVFYGHTHVYGYSQRNGRDYINLATTGGEQFPEKGRSMDHLMLVTVDGSGVSMANLLMAGILDKKGRTPLGLDPRVFEHRPDEG